MNYLHHLAEFETAEQGQEKLKEAERVRDSMGGDMYWSICNDDVEEIKQKIFQLKIKETHP